MRMRTNGDVILMCLLLVDALKCKLYSKNFRVLPVFQKKGPVLTLLRKMAITSSSGGKFLYGGGGGVEVYGSKEEEEREYENFSSNHPIIVPSNFNIEDAFSSTNSPNYLLVFPTIRNNSLNDLTKYLLDILIFSPLHDDLYMEAKQAYNAISPPQVIIALPAILPPSPVLLQSPIFDSQDFFPFEEISPKDTKTSISPSSSIGSSSPIRSTISPLDYPFDESIFTKLDNSLWITPRPLGEEPVPEEPNESNTHLWK
nr:hypothetical protein [Tanacetum cinerariifolium]